MKLSLLIALACFLFIGTADAQTDSLHLPKRFYIYGDLEFGGGGATYGSYTQVSLVVQKRNNYVRLKASENARPLFSWNDEEPMMTDLSLILGKSYTVFTCHNLKLGSGVAFIKKEKRAPLEETYKKRAVGLSLELKYCYMIDWSAGITCSLNSNLNKVDSYSVFAVGVAFGFLREKKNGLKH
ncbi:hypothetical protein VRU48_09610 [Pedobacter sp. KR3-3]|uniref:Outer membrane protein beta-barrel domain-containing protein n=1 Tax=Pedobacter albus TaxID=3113905 RepID=A0ABU7I7C8_9SPHI|nr:hypothetical protein [Pedobacter sp. KR3-3]MEE1945365.1 hypothetical protein [Pedobacter sp. KR3-3]